MIDEDFIKALLSKHTFLEFIHQTDYLTLDCPAENIIDFTKSLRDQETFDLLVDLTAIDHGQSQLGQLKGQRFPDPAEIS